MPKPCDECGTMIHWQMIDATTSEEHVCQRTWKSSKIPFGRFRGQTLLEVTLNEADDGIGWLKWALGNTQDPQTGIFGPRIRSEQLRGDVGQAVEYGIAQKQTRRHNPDGWED